MRGVPVKAAVFSAPMWGIAMAAWLRPLASVVSTLAGPLGLANRYAPSTSAETYLLQAPFQGNVLTTDREMWDYMRRQVADPDRSADRRRGVARASLSQMQHRDFGQFRRRAVGKQDEHAALRQFRHLGPDLGDLRLEVQNHRVVQITRKESPAAARTAAGTVSRTPPG